jgi:hypothetical protein
MLRTIALGLVVLTALACDDAPRDPPTVVLGSGVDDFVAIEDGRTLRITQGIQGGYHVFAAVEATGIEAWDASVAFALFQGETQIGGATFLDDFVVRDGRLIYPGVTVFLWAEHAPESVAGVETRMTVTVTDAQGRVARDALTFMPVCCDYLR